jgi:penicillin-binding protein 2
VQKYANELLKDKAAAVCVMDVYNGDIVSMVSSPTFKPNAFVHGLDKKYWNSLIKDGKKPLTNKALSGLYPPGSTIKTLVALSALENGIVRPLDTFRCKGKIELYGEKFHCWEKKDMELLI